MQKAPDVHYVWVKIAPIIWKYGCPVNSRQPNEEVNSPRETQHYRYLSKQLYFWVYKKNGSQYVYTLKECKMQNGYPSNARHKMFDLTRKAIIFNLALRPAQIVSCKKTVWKLFLCRAVVSCQGSSSSSSRAVTFRRITAFQPSNSWMLHKVAVCKSLSRRTSSHTGFLSFWVSSLSYKGPWRDDIIVQKRGNFPW